MNPQEFSAKISDHLDSLEEESSSSPLVLLEGKNRSDSTPSESTNQENISISGNVSLADEGEVQSNAADHYPGYFEGPEKTMEVVFRSDRGPEEGLRLLTRDQIDLLCKDARCTVVSTTHNHYIDSYVLSESSLFVYRHRLIMKTCGTTTLLRCLSRLFDYTDKLGLDLAYLGYSRKNLNFPTQQDWLHQSFENEISYLSTHQKLENRLRGTGHILGPITGDHWFVYVADHVPIKPMKPPSPSVTEGEITSAAAIVSVPPAPSAAVVKPRVPRNITSYDNLMTLGAAASGPGGSNSGGGGSNERTINLMMFDMAPEVAKLFYQSENGFTGREMTEKAGIHHLCPGATIDEVAFTPCGYSMNAILHDAYSTIHITPEPQCSYVSFETNTLLENYGSLVRNVLNVFRPRRFVLTMFGDQTSLDSLQSLPTESKVIGLPSVGNYCRTSVSSTQVDLELGCVMGCYTLDTTAVREAGSSSPSTVSVTGDTSDESLEDFIAGRSGSPTSSSSAVAALLREKKERSNTWC